jgi:hypothetical protein
VPLFGAARLCAITVASVSLMIARELAKEIATRDSFAARD